MDWPGSTDYSRAIQSPAANLKDPALQAGTATMGLMGLPKVASGNFACVYEVNTPQDKWAVRCFTRPPESDQQDRYSRLSEHLQGTSLHFIVNFEFQQDGIRINGTWRPIVKMKWV